MNWNQNTLEVGHEKKTKVKQNKIQKYFSLPDH